MEKEQTGGAETRVTMNNYTKEDIIRLVEEEDVEFIRLQFTDLFGNLKNIAVTASQLDRVLSNKCMFDGSAIDGLHGLKNPTCICIRICRHWRFSPGDPSRAKWPV